MCHALSRDEGSTVSNHFSAEAFRRDGFGPSPAFSCLIAEDAGGPIGYAMHCDDYDTDRMCRSLYLADLYVEKAARRRGIGRALMAATAKEGQEQGAQLMTWGALRDNDAARRFYATVGQELPELIGCFIDEAGLPRLAREKDDKSGITTRLAEIGDCAPLTKWLRALLADIGEPPPPPDSEARFRADGFGPRSAFAALIAERAGEPVGYAIHWPTYDTETAARGLWLSDLYVVPAARRAKAGRILMAEVARRAVAQNAKFINLLVLERNQRARAFYRAIGQEWRDGYAWICGDDDFKRLSAGAPPIG